MATIKKVINSSNLLTTCNAYNDNKNRRKTNNLSFFLSVERPFNINIISCNFLRSLGNRKRDTIGDESSENAKKRRDWSIFKFVERPLNIFYQTKSFTRFQFLGAPKNFANKVFSLLKLKIKK